MKMNAAYLGYNPNHKTMASNPLQDKVSFDGYFKDVDALIRAIDTKPHKYMMTDNFRNNVYYLLGNQASKLQVMQDAKKILKVCAEKLLTQKNLPEFYSRDRITASQLPEDYGFGKLNRVAKIFRQLYLEDSDPRLNAIIKRRSGNNSIRDQIKVAFEEIVDDTANDFKLLARGNWMF